MTAKRIGLLMATLLAGCASNLDVGSRGTLDAGHEAEASVVPPEPPPLETCESGDQLPIVGIWDGQFEMNSGKQEFYLESGSTSVRLSITHANAAFACGSVTFGNLTPPAPATDPDAVYPTSTLVAWTGHLWSLIEGFEMPMLQAKIDGKRLQFQVRYKDFWATWCRLQTAGTWPQPDGGPAGYYTCGVDITYSLADGCHRGQKTIDCGVLFLCENGACSCDANGCGPVACDTKPCGEPNVQLGVMSFDLHFGSEVTGSMLIDEPPTKVGILLHLRPAQGGRAP